MASCPNNTAYDLHILRAARAWGIEPALLKAHVARESAFNPQAVRQEPQLPADPPYKPTPGDASYGLAQVLERTARRLGFRGTVSQLYDPATNLDLAAHLIRDNLRTAGAQLPIAISAYNAGFSTQRLGDAKRDAQGRIINQAYVDDVLVCYSIYQRQTWPIVVPVAATEPATGKPVGANPKTLAAWGALLAGLLSFGLWLLTRAK